jgi:thioredoxin-related protein
MKFRFVTFALIMLVTAFIAVQIKAAETVSVDWQDLDKAKKAASSSGKPLLIIFHADWCGACKLMEEKTLTDNKVISWINENFIASKINADKNSNLVTEFKVRALPTTFFLKSDGSPLQWTFKPDQNMDRATGYMKSDNYLWLLKYISTKSYESKSLTEYLKANGVEL